MAKDAGGRLERGPNGAGIPKMPCCEGDLGVAYDRISDMRLAAGDTLGALEESLTGMEVVVALHRDEPSEPTVAAIAHGGSRQDGEPPSHDRRPRGRGAGPPAVPGPGARRVRAFPTTPTRPGTWAWCTAMRAMFWPRPGRSTPRSCLYERSMAIAQSRCRRRPRTTSFNRSIWPRGNSEMGTIPMKGRRGIPRRARGSRMHSIASSSLAAKDRSNTELRVQMARREPQGRGVLRRACDSLRDTWRGVTLAGTGGGLVFAELESLSVAGRRWIARNRRGRRTGRSGEAPGVGR